MDLIPFRLILYQDSRVENYAEKLTCYSSSRDDNDDGSVPVLVLNEK